MREYYSILGIGKKATDAEIISAYRKLSSKFHPDANDNDPFFSERFRELQEAYNILINPIKRSAYDAELDPRFAVDSLKKIDREKPIITYFDISKKAISEGEPVTVRWQTTHADVINIDFMGKVDTEGTKTLRLPFNDLEFIKIGLSASNSFIDETAMKYIEVRNKDFNEKKLFSAASDEKSDEKSPFRNGLKVENNTESNKTKILEKKSLDTAKTDKKQKNILSEQKKLTKKIKKERPLSKEERLAGIEVAYEDEEQPSFKFRDLYVYIVLIVLLVFVIIIAVLAYNMNPLS